jgi:type 2 lantibiotic biosynthesis protein LanM
MDFDTLIPKIFKDLDSDNLDTVSKKFFNMNLDELKMKINDEMDSLNDHDLNIEKYNFQFEVTCFEDMMLFLLKSENITYLEQLDTLYYIQKSKMYELNLNILNQIAKHLMRFSYRTLVYDLNLNRTKGKFNSSNESEQFKEYIKKLNDRHYRVGFIRRYYNLVKLLVKCIQQVDKYLTTFFINFKNDEQDLITEFGLHNNQLIDIQLGLGDTHNQGESVIKCSYSHKALYFKPRNGEIDSFYNEILDFTNEALGSHLIYPRLLLKNSYFWSEEIIYRECCNTKEIKNFYYELGVHLSLLYLLGATDFHSENLIASKEHPVLVDLESVLGNKLKKDTFKDASFFNYYLLSSSVKSTGILPFPFGNKEGTDFSGIGGKEGLSSLKVPIIKNGQSSKMKVESDYIKLDPSKNHPKINGYFSDEKHYKEEFIQGFLNCYDFIHNNKAEFEDIIKRKIDTVNIRYINNATMQYARILNLSFHPMILNSLTLRKLFISYYLYNDYDKLAEFEIQNVIDLNIPYFYYNGKTKNLFNENHTISNFFHYSLEDSILYRLNNLDFKDREWQVSLIQDSLRKDTDTFIPHMATHEIKDYNIIGNYSNSEKEQKFNELIYDIENIILNEQIEINNTYSWMTKELYGSPGNRTVEREVMEINLYKGLCGMALYYWSLFQYSNNQDYLIKSKNLIEQIEQEIQYYNDFPLGAYDGIYSYIYVCSIIYKTTKDDYFIKKAMKYIKLSKRKIDVEEDTDIISGISGVLVILINIYKIINESKYKELIKEIIEMCVTRLTVLSKKTEDNLVYWEKDNDDVLIGFAHGISGITYALNLYIENFGYDSKVANIAYSANSYEELYRIENHWPHPYSKESKPPYAWCHGSPGIMLNREKTGYHSKKTNEIISKIFEKGFSRTHCLCHGDLGNAMILKDILQTSEKVDDIIFEILKDYNGKTLKCGVGEEIQTVDLLTGLSGISYGLIYLMDNNIPNILRLEI